jgi:hypothetical protein
MPHRGEFLSKNPFPAEILPLQTKNAVTQRFLQQPASLGKALAAFGEKPHCSPSKARLIAENAC